MASPSTVITLGYGSFGSVNLIPTLGYGISVVLPPRVLYRPNTAAAPPGYFPQRAASPDSYNPARVAGPDAYSPTNPSTPGG